MRDVLGRAMFLELNHYSHDHKECVRQAVKELVPDHELREIYTMYDIDYNQYIDSASNLYLKYKQLSGLWEKTLGIE